MISQQINLQNLISQDGCQLRECLKMGDMDDERTEAVVEDETEALKELSKSWTTLLFSIHPTVRVEL